MAPGPGQDQPLKKLIKIVDWLMSREDSAPFREPVDWRGLELYDYPQIIEKMMDLGTIKRKLERGQYQTAHQVAEDVRLVWANCMLYNADGSDFWLLAKSFARRFEDRYRKIRQEYDVGENNDPPAKASQSSAKAAAKIPTGNKEIVSPSSKSTYAASAAGSHQNLDVRAQFGANLFLLSGSELGHVMTRIELDCPEVLETWGDEKVEINVDSISPKLFAALQEYVTDKIGSKKFPDETSDVRAKKRKRAT